MAPVDASRRRPPRPVKAPQDAAAAAALVRRGSEMVRALFAKDTNAIFHEPVPPEVPGYREVVKWPMDLSTCLRTLQRGNYRDPLQFYDAIKLIWSNAMLYNGKETIYYSEAVRLRQLAETLFTDMCRALVRDGFYQSTASKILEEYSRGSEATVKPAGGKSHSRRRPSRGSKPSTGSSLSLSSGRSFLSLREASSDASQHSEESSHGLGLLKNPDQKSSTPENLRERKPLNAVQDDVPDNSRCNNYDSRNPRSTLRESTQNPSEEHLSEQELFVGGCRSHPQSLFDSSTSSRKRLRERYRLLLHSHISATAPLARRLLASLLDPHVVCDHVGRMEDGTHHGENMSSSPVLSRANADFCQDKTYKAVHSYLDGDDVDLSVRGDPQRRDQLVGADVKSLVGSKRTFSDLLQLSEKVLAANDGFREDVYQNSKRKRLVGNRDVSDFAKFSTESAPSATKTSVCAVEASPSVKGKQCCQNGIQTIFPLAPPRSDVAGVADVLRKHHLEYDFLDDLMKQSNPQMRCDRSSEVMESDLGLQALLARNHAALMRIRRLKAAAELCPAPRREAMERLEQEYAGHVEAGLVKATLKLRPRFLARPVDVACAGLTMVGTRLKPAAHERKAGTRLPDSASKSRENELRGDIQKEESDAAENAAALS